MKPVEPDDAPQDFITAEQRREEAGQSGIYLRVFGEGVFATHLLPASGRLVIGRGVDADICVDHASLSRKHAVLHVGPRLLIEDLASANGTWIDGRRLAAGESAEIPNGRIVELGSVMLIVQHELGRDRPRRLWTHSYFEARLEEECARARRSRACFTLVSIRVDGGAPSSAFDTVIADAVREGDWIGEYAPGIYEVLLSDLARRDAEQIVGDLRARLTSLGARVQLGFASYPRDGGNAQLLVAKACAIASGSSEPIGPAVARGAAMEPIYRVVDRIATGSISVLLLGETGAGKEWVARAIHRRSARAEKPFVVFDCAAVAPNLIESELFGHVKGAFTGANQNREGAFLRADGGTVFLDEIGELALELQPKLLRAIELRTVRPVGGDKEFPVDVRIIAATNRSLEREIANARFREDLFYRLNGISLLIPPLRERRDEIAALARAFLADACRSAGIGAVPELSSDAEELLRAYDWPGNVRELRNAMERAVLLCDGNEILTEHLPLEKMEATISRTSLPNKSSTADSNLAAQVDAVEQARILEVLAQCAGNQSQTARQLGISRKKLLARLDAYGVRRPRKRS